MQVFEYSLSSRISNASMGRSDRLKPGKLLNAIKHIGHEKVQFLIALHYALIFTLQYFSNAFRFLTHSAPAKGLLLVCHHLLSEIEALIISHTP